MGGNEFYVCDWYWYTFGAWAEINDGIPCDSSWWLATDILDCIGGGQGN
jgi:hypothetical protein